MVGCVLVRSGRVVGEGWHRRFGDAHAEVATIDNCRKRGDDPRGCTAFVTLEPCAHQGKTPPCTDALIAAGVAQVCVAMLDPSAQVDGRGVAQLRDAGIGVTVGVCDEEARQLNEPYIKRVTTGLPWVIAKWAQTLDGAIAAADGTSKWISGRDSRRLVHRLRARMDAVIVGIGTAIADDPTLTARGVPMRRRARRVVVDPQLRLTERARLIATLDKSNPVTVAVDQRVLADPPQRMQQLAARGVEFVGLPPAAENDRQLDLCPLLQHLAQARSATNVLVEGGGRLLGTLFDQQLVDQIVAFVAPKLLADENALWAARGRTPRSLDGAHRLELRSVKRVAGDVMLDYRVIADEARVKTRR
jgi:diaminohydroxyphosphoribosylaminopyrimidine deaminase/5-amino-6-(5-phosphoribosylamino)uracil reductase